MATAISAVKLAAMTATAIPAIQQLLATSTAPALGPQPRANVRSPAALNGNLDSLFRETNLPVRAQMLIRSLILLWHDHLDAAHTLAQSIENSDGSFIHAIMHRREPDYFNAKYWWRRVGVHPAFPEIARRAGALLEAHKAGKLTAQLLPGGKWDAAAFVNACEQAERNGSPAQTELLREVQRIEFEVLLDYFCHE